MKISPDLLRNFVCVSVLCTRNSVHFSVVIYTLRSIISFHVPFSLSLFTMSLLWSIPSGLQLTQKVLLRLNRKRGQERQIIFTKKENIIEGRMKPPKVADLMSVCKNYQGKGHLNSTKGVNEDIMFLFAL